MPWAWVPLGRGLPSSAPASSLLTEDRWRGCSGSPISPWKPRCLCHPEVPMWMMDGWLAGLKLDIPGSTDAGTGHCPLSCLHVPLLHSLVPAEESIWCFPAQGTCSQPSTCNHSFSRHSSPCEMARGNDEPHFPDEKTEIQKEVTACLASPGPHAAAIWLWSPALAHAGMAVILRQEVL